MEFIFQIKNFIVFTIVFLFFTVIGTLSHEFGHISVAKILGYNTVLHFGSITYENELLKDQINKIRNKNEIAIQDGNGFPESEKLDKLLKKSKRDSLLISIGGPVQTISTGIFGLLILFFRKARIKEGGFKLIDWTAVFLALFWLREIYNLMASVLEGLLFEKGNYFGGDEAFISKGFNFSEGTIPIILGTLGLIVSVFIVFRIVPKENRFTFISAGFIGGLLGVILWMDIVGPILLP